MRAIQSVAVGKAEIVDVQEPELKPDSILVRPHYIGNNPCDWLVVDVEPMFTQNQMIGCDYCGVVEKIGSDVNTDLKLGDKVCGVVAGGAGCDATRGCFGDLFPAYGDFVFRLPNGVTEPQAATLGVGISTVAVAFYEHMKLPLPDEDPSIGQGKPFFVYGGSSAMGLFGIQFAKASGFRVITTCSPKNFDLVKSYGADEAYDYHDIEKCTEEIQKSVGDDLYYAYICAMDANSPKLCAEIFSSKGGMYVYHLAGEASDISEVATQSKPTVSLGIYLGADVLANISPADPSSILNIC